MRHPSENLGRGRGLQGPKCAPLSYQTISLPMFSFCLHESATLPGVNAMGRSDLSTPHFEADDTESVMGAGEAVASPWKPPRT